jgi:hypothetical protein
MGQPYLLDDPLSLCFEIENASPEFQQAERSGIGDDKPAVGARGVGQGLEATRTQPRIDERVR